MKLVGHGVDVVDVPRIELEQNRGTGIESAWLTTRELENLQDRVKRAEVVAGRVAAKEAVAKALRTGFSGDVTWHDIEIITSDNGAPVVSLSGGAQEVAKSLKIKSVQVSISHTRTCAFASAIALG